MLIIESPTNGKELPRCRKISYVVTRALIRAVVSITFAKLIRRFEGSIIVTPVCCGQRIRGAQQRNRQRMEMNCLFTVTGRT